MKPLKTNLSSLIGIGFITAGMMLLININLLLLADINPFWVLAPLGFAFGLITIGTLIWAVKLKIITEPEEKSFKGRA